MTSLDAKKHWTGFTVGIEDDVTHLSIPLDTAFTVRTITPPASSMA
jgi:hypothetical protein